MLKVALNAAPLHAPRTGVGRYIAGLLSALPEAALRQGGHVSVCALFGPATAGAPAASGGWGRGLRALARRAPGAYPITEALRGRALRDSVRRGQLDLYHETNHAAPRAGCPVVLTIHDLSTLLWPKTQDRARARHFRRALRVRAREAALIVVPTAAIAAEVSEHLGIPAARIRAIHHGLDAGFSEAVAPSRPPCLLYVGAIEPRKGLDVLLDAYDQSRAASELPLVLAGPSQRIDASLRTRLGRVRRGRVELLGYVPEPALAGLYRSAAAVCLPSRYEGFGFPVIEALACGVPCVISDDPALVEVAGGCAAVAPRGEVDALANALDRACFDSAWRRSLMREGPARAARFSWERCASAHLAVYQEAFQTQRPA